MNSIAEPPTPFIQAEPESLKIQIPPTASAAVIVAHPDDETLWAGGTILSNPDYSWTILALCRRSDPDRSKKFMRALQIYGGTGEIADLDDGPEQTPLPIETVERTILDLLPAKPYDLILTHAPDGEYSTHRRHEEVSQAVLDLWIAGRISSEELRLFAYEDGGGKHLPKAIDTAHLYKIYPETIRQEKYRIITEVYGFDPESWEARTITQNEAFWSFQSPRAFTTWLEGRREEP